MKKVFKVTMTKAVAQAIIESESYQRWKAYVISCADWRYLCYKTFYPDEGNADIKFVEYVNVYLRYDTEDYVRPKAREIEFTMWLIENGTSDKDVSANRLLKGYCRTHLALVESIADEKFKGSDAYASIMRVISRFKSIKADACTSVSKAKEKPLECKEYDKKYKAFQESISYIGEQLCRERYIELNGKRETIILCRKGKEGKFIFIGRYADDYRTLVKMLTKKFWGERSKQIMWRYIDPYFDHSKFTKKSITSARRERTDSREFVENYISRCIRQAERERKNVVKS